VAARARTLGWQPAAVYRRHDATLLGVLGLVLFIGGWELGARAGVINPLIVSSPLRIMDAFQAQLRSGVLLGDLGTSIVELGIGFGLAVVVGIGLGIVMGLSRRTEYWLDPFLWFLYSAPMVALYPLLVVWLGFGFATVVAITFLLTVVSIVVNTIAGVQAVDGGLIRAVRAFGGTQRDVILKVVLPASVPLVLAGLRIGLGRALIGVVLGEMFGANAGLGFRTTVYAARLRTADTFVPLIAIVLIGVVATQALKLLEARLQSWKG
jgi:NitT/TauT family transport system permease protein